jgi:4,5-dihydroxyphthalate decarboxylase
MTFPRLRTVLGNHAHVQPLKRGEVRSDLFELEFIDYTPTNRAFKAMVREQAFDVCEMAIVTYLMAKAHRKPLVLLPAVMLGRFQHAYAIYNSERGTIGPGDLKGKRVGIRSFTTTTGAWIRGILANDYGVDLENIHWITFEDPHVLEYRDTTERAPKDKNIVEMLLNGELDAVLGETSNDPRLKPLFPDPGAEAGRWFAQHQVVPVNHLVVVTEKLARERPQIVREIYDLFKQSKAMAGQPATPDPVPFGVEANRKSLQLIIDYAAQQSLIPRRFSVEELFDETTRGLV